MTTQRKTEDAGLNLHQIAFYTFAVGAFSALGAIEPTAGLVCAAVFISLAGFFKLVAHSADRDAKKDCERTN